MTVPPSPTLPPSSRIAISGASGLLGSHLTHFLKKQGHTVYKMVRSRQPDDPLSIYWNYEKKEIDQDRLEGLNAVVHLAGANILNWPWTAEKKRLILESRSLGTSFISDSLAALDRPPEIFVSASGISCYGHQESRWVDESAPFSTRSFLADVCRHWEQPIQEAELLQTRTVSLRIGIVLGKESLIMKQVVPFFSLGLGARLWPDNPYISWISLQDTIQSIYHVLCTGSLNGPVNIVAPEPVTQHEFAEHLARALDRPLWLSMPSTLIELLAGEMGRETILTSTRVRPAKLLDSRYPFIHPDLDGFFAALFQSQSF